MKPLIIHNRDIIKTVFCPLTNSHSMITNCKKCYHYISDDEVSLKCTYPNNDDIKTLICSLLIEINEKETLNYVDIGYKKALNELLAIIT